jgi:hypothetical protein
MSAAPAVEEPVRADILAAARLAGLCLSAPFEAEMLDACAHLRPLLARLHRPRPRGDEPAHVFDPQTFQSGSG